MDSDVAFNAGPAVYICLFPIAILIGFSAGAIGFTGWTVIIPMLFSGGVTPLFDALVISVLLDLINGTTLAIYYYRRDRLNIFYGVVFGLISITGCVVGLLFTWTFFEHFGYLFRSGLGYMDFILAVVFFVRGYRLYKEEKSQNESEIMPEIEIETIFSAADQSDSTPPASFDETKTITASGDAKTDPVVDERLIEVSGVDILRDMIGRRRWALACFVVWIAGILGGLIGFGGGLIFVMVFFVLLKEDQLTSVGTACMVMALMTFCTSAVYLTQGFFNDIEISWDKVWPLFIVILSGGIIGSVIATKFVFKVPLWTLNVIIGVVLLTIGIFAVVKGAILSTIGLITQ
eukprot:TRINITY_DN11355_c0_g1_i1.p1 TRINITY_DN11355_c0_g1~~TRINITY_DN11355_c0_g1_i1.p1  ORF type:complete len:347 (-),score=91.73 TRINITY_DN11355_c0_g1_i1:60-1100(-)